MILPHSLLCIFKGFGEEIHVLEGGNQAFLFTRARWLKRDFPCFVCQCMLENKRL